MNDSPHSDRHVPLDAAAALDAAWFGSGPQPPPGSAEQHTGLPSRAEHGWLSWLFSNSPTPSSSSTRTDSRSPRRPSSRSGAVGTAQQRQRSSGAERQPRIPRPASAPKLQAAGNSGQAGRAKPPLPQQVPPSPGTAGTPADPVNSAATHASDDTASGKRLVGLTGRPSFLAKGGSRAAARAANYAERRQAWRQRIEAIKAKQASRAASLVSDTLGGVAGGGGGGPATKVFSKHVAIPVVGGGAGSRGSSTHNTPYGSPTRRDLLSDAAGAALPQLEPPLVWQGFQTSEAPPDLAAASDEQLRRFLQQAGWPMDAVQALLDRDSLVAAARSSRGAWEVERIMACTWPEEVLRVPRKCGDAAALKAAFRRCSMAVHPDKCAAPGASDAMSIVADCHNVLQAAAAAGRAAGAVPAFMRQPHPARHANGIGIGSNLAAAAGVAGMAAGVAAGHGSTVAGDSAPGFKPPHRSPSGQQHAGHDAGQGAPGVGAHGSARRQHSRHASADSFFGADMEQHPGDRHLEEHLQHFRQTSSSGGEAPPLRSSASGSSHDHWNPHGHFSSEAEAEASNAQGAADAAGAPAWAAYPANVKAETTAAHAATATPSGGASASAGMRSRSSSSGSVSTSAAAPAGMPSAPPSRSASSSLSGSVGAGSGMLHAATEGLPPSRPSSSGNMAAGVAPRPASPAGVASAEAAQANSSPNAPSTAPPAAPSSAHSSPLQASGGAGAAPARPSSAASASPASAARSRPGPVPGLAAGPGKIRVTLKVRSKS